jgi:hypothetical protein
LSPDDVTGEGSSLFELVDREVVLVLITCYLAKLSRTATSDQRCCPRDHEAMFRINGIVDAKD